MRNIVSLDISSFCNLRCVICSLDKFYEKKKFMDLALFKKILVDLQDFQVQVVKIGWCGEPLMHPHALEIIQDLKAAGIYIELTTNGTLLDKKTADSLIKSGVDLLNISLDGSSKEVYERVRVGSDFNLVVQNVAYYVKHKLKNQEINLVSTIFSENISDLNNIVDFAGKQGFDNIALNMAVPHSPGIISSDRMDLEMVKKALSNAIEKSSIPVIKPTFDESKGCRYMTYAITAEGDVVPCPVKLYDREAYFKGKKVLMKKHSFGNLKTASLKEIINSKKFQSFVNTARENYKETCGDCLLMKGCFTP